MPSLDFTEEYLEKQLISLHQELDEIKGILGEYLEKENPALLFGARRGAAQAGRKSLGI